MTMGTSTEWCFEHRNARLFHLQEQGVPALPLQESNPAVRSHAANSYDFHSDVGKAVAIEEDAPVTDLRQNRRLIVDASQEWRVMTDPACVAGGFGQLVERSQVVAVPSSRRRAPCMGANRSNELENAIDIDSGIPDVQRSLRRVGGDVLTVRSCGCSGSEFPLPGGHTDVARGDNEARREASDVPLPRAT